MRMAAAVVVERSVNTGKLSVAGWSDGSAEQIETWDSNLAKCRNEQYCRVFQEHTLNKQVQKGERDAMHSIEMQLNWKCYRLAGQISFAKFSQN